MLLWDQLRRDRQRELVAAAVARSLVLQRARLASYPAAFEAMAPLSIHNRARLTAQAATGSGPAGDGRPGTT